MKNSMQIQELPMRAFLAHLRRHPIPEIMDGDCLAALQSVEAQYGDTITHGAGLEVRLGEEARYVDYIMNIDETAIPHVESLWYEIDYGEFRRVFAEGGKIEPCLFSNIGFDSGDVSAWDAILPPFLGEARAKKLRAALDGVREKLPKGAYIKQIGTMTGRGEITIMRLVIMFPSWEMIPDGLANLGWQGDTAALRVVLAPWRETQTIAVNIDLGETGVLPKIGVEVFSRWRHPLLVDKFITRLEDAGLCLKSKGDALRRWIRIRPDGDPFIQTLIAYFKLNYRDGKIAEAKAYLEQSPYVHHHYFDAYERPIRLDMVLTKGDTILPVGDALARLQECAENRVRHVRLYGGEGYEHWGRLTAACRDGGIKTEVVLSAGVRRERLEKMIEAGADSFLVEIGSPTETDAGMEALSLLRDLKFPIVRAKWRMHAKNAEMLADLVRRVEALGVKELVITGMCAEAGDSGSPNREAIERAAKFIDENEKEKERTEAEDAEARTELTVDPCFSPLRAFLGGEDPKQNANRGVGRGCGAGRVFLALRADGNLAPCLYHPAAGKTDAIVEYWEKSPELETMRKEESNAACGRCPYERRCLPCPAVGEITAGCALAGNA